MKTKFVVAVLVLAAIAAASCGPSGDGAGGKVGEGAEKQTVVLMTHDSFNISETVRERFESENNATLEILKTQDAGSALNQAILSKNNPLADVFFGVDNTFFSRAIDEGIFEAYESPLLGGIPAGLRLDPENRLLPVDYGDVCLNYDRAVFGEEAGLQPPPSTLEDLAKPEYAGMTVVENPATSSPGLAFLLATVAHFGEEGYLDYWKSLRENGLLVVEGWEEAYWGQFSAASEGDRPIVVSYASSPVVEVYYSDKPLDAAPTGVVTAEGACFRQIEFVGILKGAKNRPLAEKLVDFMLDTEFQEDIPLQMFVYPANAKAQLPDVFVKHSSLPEETAQITPGEIAEGRSRWIEAWTQTVLR